MIGRWLRSAILAELIFLLFSLEYITGGRLIFTAGILTCVAVVVLNFCVVAALYMIARLYSAAPHRAGGARTWRCAFDETLALFAVFAVIQPFERWWMGADPARPPSPGRTPILLVHGYVCNRGLWWWLRRRLSARHYVVATVNLEPPLAGIDRLAARLSERIEALLAETGAEAVMLVTHSMGGLASRAYLRRYGASHVAGLVTLAAPHHGTRVARLGFGRNAEEMTPNSAWLQRLNGEAPASIPITNVWSLDDEIIDPPDAGRLANAHEIVLAGIGHMAMVFSPAVLACIEAELTRP